MAQESTSKLKNEIENLAKLKTELEQARKKLDKSEEEAKVATATKESLKAEVRKAKDLIAELETKVTNQTVVTEIREGTGRAIWDQEEALLEVLKKCRDKVRNGLIPMSKLLEIYNGLVPKELRLDKAQRLTALIKSATNQKGISRQGKFEGKNERCLVWNKPIIELIESEKITN